MLFFADKATIPPALLFWLLFIFWIIFGGVSYWRGRDAWTLGGNIVLLVLILLLGIGTFGSPF